MGDAQDTDSIARGILDMLEGSADSESLPGSYPRSGDRRRFLRVAMRRPVEVAQSDGSWITVWGSDISEGGIRVVSPYNTDAGRTFQLRFKLSVAGGEQILELHGQVSHVHLADGFHYAIGLQFRNLDGRLREVIRTYVTERCTLRSRSS